MNKRSAAWLAAGFVLALAAAGCNGTPPGTNRAATSARTGIGATYTPPHISAGAQDRSASLPGPTGDGSPPGQAAGTAAGGGPPENGAGQ